MSPDQIDLLITALTIFTLAILVGFAVISKVPATLHTPLMSGANSIHGIVLVGAMLIAAEARGGISQALSLIAVAFATMNVVGGYVVTDRMLQMFKKRPAAPKPPESAGPDENAGPDESAGQDASAGPAEGTAPDKSGASA